jgi:hypothetical protein
LFPAPWLAITMKAKRNPVKQIMSEIHRDVRSGRVNLDGHDGFVAEVKRRLAAAGLREDDMPDLSAKRQSHDAD